MRDAHETTIAFLTLPTRFLFDDGAGLACGGADESEYWRIGSHMSGTVDINSLLESERQKPRFKRALKALGLQPYVNPVQLLPLVEHEYRGSNELKLSKACGTEVAKRGDERGKAMLENNVKSECQTRRSSYSSFNGMKVLT
jgi:hypothetical protein